MYLDQYGDILTVNDVCDILRIGKNQAYDLLSSGKLKAFHTSNRTWKIPKKSLTEYLFQNTYQTNKSNEIRNQGGI